MLVLAAWNPMENDAYREICELLLNNSDSYMFCLINMGKVLINERNAPYCKEHEIGYVEEFKQDDHKKYLETVKPYIDIIRDDIIDRHFDTGYLDQLVNREMEVFRVAVSKKTKLFLDQANGFSKWQYPLMPENLCFFSGDRCICKSIAHENLCFFYGKIDPIKKILKEHGIPFDIYTNQKPLMLS